MKPGSITSMVALLLCLAGCRIKQGSEDLSSPQSLGRKTTGTTLSLHLRWIYDSRSLKHLVSAFPAAERDQRYREFYQELRDATITLWRSHIDGLRRHVNDCCNRFGELCQTSINYDFAKQPIKVNHPPTYPANLQNPQMQRLRTTGILVVYGANLQPAHFTHLGYTNTHGISLWSGSDDSCLAHELGHMGGYREGNHQHSQDPKNLMYAYERAERRPDLAWCQAVKRLLR